MQNSHAGAQGCSCASLAQRTLTWDPHPHSPVPSFKPSPRLSPAPACSLLLSPCELHPRNAQIPGKCKQPRDFVSGSYSWTCCCKYPIELGLCSSALLLQSI